MSLDRSWSEIEYTSQQNLRFEKNKLEELRSNIELMDPAQVLKLGYSITRVKGKLIKNDTILQPGDELVTEMKNLQITSTISKHEKS